MSASRRRAIVLVAVLSVAAACTSGDLSPSETADSGPPSSAPVDQGPPSVEPASTVQGWVTAGDPVTDASVQVLDATGAAKLTSPVRTDANGYFDTGVPFSADLTVVSTGGNLDQRPLQATLIALLDDGPEADAALHMVDVNIATTIHARAMQRNPGLSEQDAAASTTAALELDPKTGLGQDLTLSDREFNQDVFVAAADDVGIDATIDRVASFDGSQPIPGVVPDGPAGDGVSLLDDLDDGFTRSLTADQAAALMASATNDVAAVTFIPEVVEEIVKNILVEQGQRLITQQLGLPTEKSSLPEIQRQLDQILGRLADLDRQTQQLAANTVFQTSVDAIRPYISNIVYVMRVYVKPMAAAAQAAQSAAALAAANPGDVAASEAAKSAKADYEQKVANFTRDYSAKVGGAYNVIAGFLLPGPVGSKTVLQKYGDTLRPKRFITAQDSTDMHDLYTYFASWQAVSAYMEAEYQSARRGDFAEAIGLYAENTAAQQAALPTPLPRWNDQAAVFDVANGLLWATRGSTTPTTWQPDGVGWAAGPSSVNDPWRPYWASDPSDAAKRLSGWRAPTIAELQSLRDGKDLLTAMRSRTSDTGFGAGYWNAMQPVRWWSSDVQPTQLLVRGSVSQYYTMPGHRVMENDGTVRQVPDFTGKAITPSQWDLVKAEYDKAAAFVIPVRPPTPAERYLP